MCEKEVCEKETVKFDIEDRLKRYDLGETTGWVFDMDTFNELRASDIERLKVKYCFKDHFIELDNEGYKLLLVNKI